jgi:hypothetical protein
MSSQTELSRLTVEQYAERFRTEMVPLGSRFSYFFGAMPLNEEEVKEYLSEPIAALPPAIVDGLPPVSICLVPYLDKVYGKDNRCYVSMEKPPANRSIFDTRSSGKGGAFLLFAIEDRDVAEYHYRLYRSLATLLASTLGKEARESYFNQIREELSAHVHGEVDEGSWKLKQALVRRPASTHRDSKAFREYALESFIDTLTLYLHGICCDIDVDTGPRQLPSRYVRKRLDLLKSLYPPPANYAVYPEDLKD